MSLIEFDYDEEENSLEVQVDGEIKGDISLDSEEFTCDECEKSFDTKRGLSAHVAQAHGD